MKTTGVNITTFPWHLDEQNSKVLLQEEQWKMVMQLEVAKTRLQIFSRITQSLQFVILFSVGSLNLRGNMLIKYKKV